jgi:hypothetical protein
MDTLMQVLAVVTIVGGLLSLYWFVEKFDRTVRNRRDTYLHVDRAPEPACKREYTP